MGFGISFPAEFDAVNVLHPSFLDFVGESVSEHFASYTGIQTEMERDVLCIGKANKLQSINLFLQRIEVSQKYAMLP